MVQGSVFWPNLYAAYSNDIVHCFTYGKPILYADELKIIFYRSVKYTQVIFFNYAWP